MLWTLLHQTNNYYTEVEINRYENVQIFAESSYNFGSGKSRKYFIDYLVVIR